METTPEAQGSLQDRLVASANTSSAPEISIPPSARQEGDVSGDTNAEADADGGATTPYYKSSRCVELAFCVVFFFATYVALFILPISPRRRPIPFQLLENSGDYVRNLTNNESFDGETVSSDLLMVVSLLMPLVIQEILSFFRCASGGKSYYDMHATLCVYMVASAINFITTDAAKLYVGYLRPIFYEECQPDEDYAECTADNGGGNSIRKSFPSGHSSISFCGLTLLTLYIHNRFGMAHRIKQRRRTGLSSPGVSMEESESEFSWAQDCKARAISILSLVPMGLALFIATSRIVDNKHFPADVVGGSVLGAAIASFIHGLWF